MKAIKKKEEVERFLKQFLPKLDIWGVIFIDREKNDAALRSMGITPNARETIIRSIETDDYVETITDIVSWGDMWVFGKDAFDREIYIKITLGQPNSKTICISFHESEHEISYAFKNKKGGE